MNKYILLLRIVSAGILLQTLFFKFSGAPESIYIFSTLGMEPLGRWLSGMIELTAAVLILHPRTQAFGAVLAIGVMAGAILSHLTVLGIEVQGDRGLLFALALTVFGCSTVIAYARRNDLITMTLRFHKPN